jgi:hypothetical protein
MYKRKKEAKESRSLFHTINTEPNEFSSNWKTKIEKQWVKERERKGREMKKDTELETDKKKIRFKIVIFFSFSFPLFLNPAPYPEKFFSCIILLIFSTLFPRSHNPPSFSFC